MERVQHAKRNPNNAAAAADDDGDDRDEIMTFFLLTIEALVYTPQKAANTNCALDGLGFILSCSGSGVIKLWKGAAGGSQSSKSVRAGRGAAASSSQQLLSTETHHFVRSTNKLDSDRVNYSSLGHENTNTSHAESWEYVTVFFLSFPPL